MPKILFPYSLNPSTTHYYQIKEKPLSWNILIRSIFTGTNWAKLEKLLKEKKESRGGGLRRRRSSDRNLGGDMERREGERVPVHLGDRGWGERPRRKVMVFQFSKAASLFLAWGPFSVFWGVGWASSLLSQSSLCRTFPKAVHLFDKLRRVCQLFSNLEKKKRTYLFFIFYF